MSQKSIDNIKNIDKLQGLVYQNLMTAFNNLEKNVNINFDDAPNVDNVQKLKQIILTRLKTSVNYINSQEFKTACITCSAARILGLLKYRISTEFTSEEDRIKATGEAVVDHKIDKKYTTRFFEIVDELKQHITKYLSSKQLRKQFLLSDFCIHHLKKEKKAIDQTYPDNAEINLPAWITGINEENLDKLTEEVIELLKNEDYEGFKKLIDNNNYY